MKRFLFSTADFPGYVDWGGLLETACLLQDRGHQVRWASGPGLSSILNKVNIELLDVPVAFNAALKSSDELDTNQDQRSKRLRLYRHYLNLFMDEEQVAAACDAHLRLISRWSPDVVIADPTILGAALAAEAAGIPLAGCGYPGSVFVIPASNDMAPLSLEFYQRLNRLRKRVGLGEAERKPEADFLFIAPKLHLVYTTPGWFDFYNARTSPGAQYVGGRATSPRTPTPSWLAELPGDRPRILIGRSTNYGTMSEAITIAFEVIREIGGYGVLGGLPELRNKFAPLPHYIRWEPWVSYEHVMPHMDAALHHGGLGTTCLAVHHAIPQVLVPEVIDNYTHADSIARSGAGLALYDAVNTNTLVQALREILGQPRFRTAALRLQAQFASLGGTPRAADLLQALAVNTPQQTLGTAYSRLDS